MCYFIAGRFLKRKNDVVMFKIGQYYYDNLKIHGDSKANKYNVWEYNNKYYMKFKSNKRIEQVELNKMYPYGIFFTEENSDYEIFDFEDYIYSDIDD